MKKLLTICAAVLIAMTLCAIANADVVLCDFEDSTLQGWQAQNALLNSGHGDLQVMTNPVTGSLSMAIMPGQYDEDNLVYTGFDFSVKWDGLAVPAFNPAVTPIVQLEVTWVSEEWEDLDWLELKAMALNSINGWSQADCIDTTNPSYPGSWNTQDWGATHTRTLQWDFTGYNIEGIDWGPQIQLATNLGSAEQAGYYYIDNVKLIVPEPATMLMLGLGVLSLIRRKK